MVYLKLATTPEINGKCILIGNTTIVPDSFEYAFSKYPQNLTSNTSDPTWNLSYHQSYMTVFDNTEMYYAFDGNDETCWHVKQTSPGINYTLLQFTRTDNALFTVSKISYYGYMNLTSVFGISYGGGLVGFLPSVNDNSVEELHTLEFEPISVCGFSIRSLSGGGVHEIKLYNFKVE